MCGTSPCTLKKLKLLNRLVFVFEFDELGLLMAGGIGDGFAFFD